MELTTSAGSVAVGNTFVVNAGVVHDGSVGAYSAAQWSVGYDNTIVQYVSSVKDAAGPAECISHSDNTVRTLLGCLSLAGPTMTFSGVAWNVTYTCIAPGPAALAFLGASPSTTTFVKIGTVVQPIHTHTVSVTCTGAALPTSTSTATATRTATPVATNTPGPTATTTPTPLATNTPYTILSTTPTASVTPLPGDQTPQPAATVTSAAPQPVATQPGGGAGAGVVRPPDTGTGPSADHPLVWLWVALGVAAIGGAAGAIGWRRRARLG